MQQVFSAIILLNNEQPHCQNDLLVLCFYMIPMEHTWTIMEKPQILLRKNVQEALGEKPLS